MTETDTVELPTLLSTPEPFVVDASLYTRSLAGQWIARWGAWFLVPVIACLLAGIYFDIRWIAVAFMIPCVVYPLMLMLVYYSKVLTLGARSFKFRQKVTYRRDDRQITVDYYALDENDDRPLPGRLTVDTAAVKAIDSYRGCYRLEMSAGHDPKFLFIPFEAIERRQNDSRAEKKVAK